jgi:hypothetical protein
MRSALRGYTMHARQQQKQNETLVKIDLQEALVV